MKKLFLFSAALMFSIALSAQTQQGYVKTKGRMSKDGTVVPGQRIPSASVILMGGNSTVSGDDGVFSLLLPNSKYYLQNVQKKGYVLSDPEVLSKEYIYSKNDLILVMETPSDQWDDKRAAEKAMREQLQKRVDEQRTELDRLREEMHVSDKEYRERLQRIFELYDENDKLVNEMAVEYAKIDYDLLDEHNRIIRQFILSGELQKADSLIHSKGNIDERIKELHRHQDANSKEAETLVKRQAQLEASQIGTQNELNDIAQDCYNLFEICKMQHLYDSAAYYLELRAGLDTTNINWQKDAGEFELEYMADHEKPLKIFQNLLYKKITELGESHPSVATCYFNLGTAYCYTHDFGKALECCQKALAITPKDDYALLGKIHNSLGVINTDLGKYEEAERHLLLALENDKLLYNDNHPEIATQYINLGLYYKDKGDYEKALHYLTSGLTIFESIPDDKSIEIAICLNNIGTVYSSLGQYEKSLDYFLQSLSQKQTIWGVNHPNTISSINNIGIVYQHLGKYSEALDYHRTALAKATQLFGESDPIVATYYNNLASAYENIEDYDKAMELYEKALIIRENTYGKNHPETAGSYNNIGLLLSKQGKYEQSLEYLEFSLESLISVIGDNHPYIAACYNNIGIVYSSLGDYDKAINFYNLALKIIIPFVGESHPNVGSCYASIGAAYMGLNNYLLALEYYKKAYSIRSQVFGESHSLTQSSAEKISEIQAKLKEQENQPNE